MYRFIINPINGHKIKVSSNEGMNIIKKYVRLLVGGSHTVTPTYDIEYTKPRIVIVGAGPIGLLSGIFAIEKGYDTTIIEKRSEDKFADREQIIRINQSNMHNFNTIKFNDGRSLRDRLFIPKDIVVTESDPRPLSKNLARGEYQSGNAPYTRLLKNPKRCGARGEPIFTGHISLKEIQKELYEKYKELGGEIKFNYEIKGIKKVSEPTVKYICIVNVNSNTIALDFDILVGADGAKSKVRQIVSNIDLNIEKKKK